MFRGVLFVIFFGTILTLSGQAKDSATEVKPAKEPLRLFSFSDPHSPKKATIYAAVIPGLGQLYNRKYWKVPIVYATFGVATAFMLDNRSKMRALNTQFRKLYAINPDTTIDPNKIFLRDNYRKYRDFAILAMSAIYVLQIIDATVDAHFYKLNIDQNLQAKLNPAPGRIFQLTYTF